MFCLTDRLRKYTDELCRVNAIELIQGIFVVDVDGVYTCFLSYPCHTFIEMEEDESTII